MVNIDSTLLPAIGVITAAIHDFTAFPFNPGFPIKNITSLATSLPTHSWEYGTAAQMLLELYNPEYSVFGLTPFPVPVLDRGHVRSLGYAFGKIEPELGLGMGYSAFSRGNGAAGDPASLGVAGVMLGKGNETYARAARETWEGLLRDVPRFWNGAISHRAAVAELWADFMYMVPPFLAYAGADADDEGLIQESVRQSRLYRQILRNNETSVWRHIIGPQAQDLGMWATGNAWAAAGMTRVLATIIKAPIAANAPWREGVVREVTGYIKEILDGVMRDGSDGGLVRNYMYDRGNVRAWGEISGSTLLASVVYRMAVLSPSVFGGGGDASGGGYLKWADGVMETIASGKDADGRGYVLASGVVRPAVNPLDWHDVRRFESGSPEGNCFVVLMYAAWRDCVLAQRCRNPDAEPISGGGGGGGGDDDTAGDKKGTQDITVIGRQEELSERAKRSREIHRRSTTHVHVHAH